MTTMNAAVLEAKGQLVVKAIDRPTIGDYQCLCETLFGSICTGTDKHLINADPPFCHWIKLPAVLGHESVGRVVEVGPKVRHLKLGDRITRVGAPPANGIGAAWGGFAEYTVATDWQAMADDGIERSQWAGHMVNQVLPESISAAAGTMFITWRETLSYCTRLGITAGSSVLVIGSGANGLAMAQHARNLGATSCVMIGSPNREETGRRAGATSYVDYRAEDARQQALAAHPTGFDFAIDVIGTGPTADLAHSCVAADGTLAIYGMDKIAEIALKPNASFGTFRLYRGGYSEAEAHATVCEMVADGRLDHRIWLDEDAAFALADIHQAFAAIDARTQVKPLIRIGGE